MIKNINKKIPLFFLGILSFVSIVFLASIFISQPSITVTKTIPANNSTDVPVTTSNVNISFDKNISDKDSKKITYDVQPQLSSESLVSGNQITIGFKENLQKGATYMIGLKYNGKQIYKLVFETESITQEQILKEGSLQSKADKEFSDTYKGFIQKYPWYLKIPIENSNYRVVYDFDKNMFRIRILSTTATADEIKSLTQNALSDLKKIGVSEPVKYYVLDVNGNQL